jgi:purine-binding chemotaxis protein CheW
MIAVAPLPKSPSITLGVINLHGRVLPVVDLRRRFNLPLREYGLTTHLLVVHTTQRQLGLPVDEVVGVMEVSRSAVTPPTILTGIGHVLGIVPLADGLLFIHDLERVLSLDEERSLARALGETEG